jgi:hypothetical protein
MQINYLSTRAVTLYFVLAEAILICLGEAAIYPARVLKQISIVIAVLYVPAILFVSLLRSRKKKQL